MKKKSKNIVHKKRISKRRNLYGGKNGKMPHSCVDLPPTCTGSWREYGIFKNKITSEENIKIYRCEAGGHFCASDGKSGDWIDIDKFYESIVPRPKMPAPCGNGNLQADCMADSWIEIGNIYKNKISGIGNIKIYRCAHKDALGSHFCASDGASGYWDNIDRFYEID